jgi:hypothetical protein
MKTALLDNTAWDLVLDAAGDLAIATEPYQFAQDVASAIRLFLGELWYDTTKGVPYMTDILGHNPPITYFQALMEQAAFTVPGVDTAVCTISELQDRTITGEVRFTTLTGQTGTVTIGAQ